MRTQHSVCHRYYPRVSCSRLGRTRKGRTCELTLRSAHSRDMGRICVWLSWSYFSLWSLYRQGHRTAACRKRPVGSWLRHQAPFLLSNTGREIHLPYAGTRRAHGDGIHKQKANGTYWIPSHRRRCLGVCRGGHFSHLSEREKPYEYKCFQRGNRKLQA